MIELAPNWLRARMGLEKESRVLQLNGMHYGGSESFQFEDSWINLTKAPKDEAENFEVISPNN